MKRNPGRSASTPGARPSFGRIRGRWRVRIWSLGKRTDTELDRLIAAYPEAVFLLTGLPSPGPCQWRPLVVKKLLRTADGLVVPDDPQQPLTVVEDQFRQDDDIYRRVAEEMIAAQREYGRPVQGAILFRYASHDPQTDPWCRIIRSFVLRDVVKRLEREHPNHPLVAVFQPVLRTNEETVEREAANYYRAIRDSDLAEPTRAALNEVLLSWLVQRLRHKSRKEIEAMLLGELPPLEETQCGKELIEIGEERGEARGFDNAILVFLTAQFGTLPATLRKRVSRLTVPEAKRVLSFLPQAKTLKDVESHLAKTRKPASE